MQIIGVSVGRLLVMKAYLSCLYGTEQIGTQALCIARCTLKSGSGPHKDYAEGECTMTCTRFGF